MDHVKHISSIVLLFSTTSMKNIDVTKIRGSLIVDVIMYKLW